MKLREGNSRQRHRYGGRTYWPTVLLLVAYMAMVACIRQPETGSSEPPESGYLVQPAFTPTYEVFGRQILGEPISGMCESASGKQVQYFENVRLELLEGSEEVVVHPLGAWAYSGVRRVVEAPVPDNSRTRLFEETGYDVRDEFLDFYERYQGEKLLGPPISPQLDEGNLRVQYFQNARLEWHPGAPPEERVQLGMLGQAHYLQSAHDVVCELLAQPVDVTSVRNTFVLASAEAPILYTGEEQIIYAMVTTPAGVPVAGAPVTLTLRDLDWTLSVDLGRTDASGRVQGGLTVPRFVPGRMVGVSVEVQGLGGVSLGRTGLAFQTWW